MMFMTIYDFFMNLFFNGVTDEYLSAAVAPFSSLLALLTLILVIALGVYVIYRFLRFLMDLSSFR